MSRCVAALRRCVLDWLLDLVRDVKHEEAWAALPQRIILIRHGQAEHNLEEGAVRLACAAPAAGVSPAQPVPRVRWPALLAASRRPLAAPALALGRTLAISRPEVCSSHTPEPGLGQILQSHTFECSIEKYCKQNMILGLFDEG